MKIKSLAVAGFLAISTGITAQDNLIDKVEDNGSESGDVGYQFETVLDLETTPVKNQGRSGTCWSYATTSFIETEMIRMGKEPVDLSEMFTVRQVYLDKAEKYVRLHGHLNFAQGGALPDVLYVIKKYGAVPQEVYEGLDYGTEENNHGELESVLKAQLDQVIKNPNKTELTPSWRKAFIATLDAYLGEYPEEFEWEGKTYTPRSFADEVIGINPDDYVQFTSFTHQPMYEEIMIQVPDNWAWATSYNLKLDEMEQVVDHSLREGYSLSWATDVSEDGFSLKNGLAIVPQGFDDMEEEEQKKVFQSPHPEVEVGQDLRQKSYDNYTTTDDHGMQITGKVKDQDGDEYYIIKNSWGERENDYRTGYIYASKPFFRYKTISVLVHRDAVPKDIEKKVDL